MAPSTVYGLPHGRQLDLAVDRVIKYLGLPLYYDLLPRYSILGIPKVCPLSISWDYRLLDLLRVVVSRFRPYPLSLLDRIWPSIRPVNRQVVGNVYYVLGSVDHSLES